MQQQQPKFVNNSKKIIIKNNISESQPHPQPQPPNKLLNGLPLLQQQLFLESSGITLPPLFILYNIV